MVALLVLFAPRSADLDGDGVPDGNKGAWSARWVWAWRHSRTLILFSAAFAWLVVGVVFAMVHEGHPFVMALLFSLSSMACGLGAGWWAFGRVLAGTVMAHTGAETHTHTR